VLFVTSSVLFILHSKDSVTYPPELDTLVRKLMLFKVELTDGNLAHNWRNYSVKCATDDKDLIKKFMTLHKIKVVRISFVLCVVSL
jgi:hypothetical protein